MTDCNCITVVEDTYVIEDCNGDVSIIAIDDADVELIEVCNQGPPGVAGVGVPAGGLAGQILKKLSDTDYDTGWGTGGGGGDVESVNDVFADVSGNISLDTDDIPQGSVNKYFANALAIAAIAGAINAPLTYSSPFGFGITQAGVAQDGYLSQADWNTFSNKQNALPSGTTAQYLRGDKTFQTLNTSVVPELTNLYYTQARFNAAIAAISGAANGIAPLGADSKIPSAYLPPLAITETFVVSSQAAMLALAAQTGDIAVRTDLSQTFILQGADPTILSNWVQLATPGSPVLSVNGFTGAVTLTTTNISEGTNLYFTDERAQDAIGAMIDSSLVYVDATPLLSRAALTGDITAGAGSNVTAYNGVMPLTKGGWGLTNARTDISSTGTVNNQAVTSVWLNFTGGSSVTLTGLAAGSDGTEVVVTNNLSDITANLTLANASTSSTAANRFAFPSNVALRTGQSVRLRYNTSQNRWNLVGQAYSVSLPLLQTGTLLSIQQASSSLSGYISNADYQNIAFINLSNTFSALQNFDAGIHVEKSGPVLTTNPSSNQFDAEGGCDGTPFNMGDVLEVRVRSFKIIGGIQYGSTNVSNSYIHTFTANACVDAEFQGDDFATIDGWVVEQNLNGGGWGLSNTVGNISPASGTINYHLENNGSAALLPDTIITSVELGGYNDGTRVYSVYSTDPAHFSTIFLDNPLPVEAGGTAQNDGTLKSGGSPSIDWYNRTLSNTSGTVFDYQNALLYGGGGNAVINLPSHQLLDNSGGLKYDFNLGWTYIGGFVRLLMNNIPAFAAGVSTDVILKLIPTPGQSADYLQLRNQSDSANLASFNKVAAFLARAGSTSAATAGIYLASGSLMTSPEIGAVEFLTDKAYLTITTGTARKEFTLNDSALTSGRIPFATTNGRLNDTTDFTFSTGTGLTLNKPLFLPGTAPVALALNDNILFDDVSNSDVIAKTTVTGVLNQFDQGYQRGGYSYFNHFINPVSATSQGGDSLLALAISGGTIVSQTTDSATRVGIIRSATGTGTTGRAGASSNAAALRLGGYSWAFEKSLNITTLSNSTDRFQVIVGFHDIVTVANQTDGVYFLYDEGGISTGSAASANWQCVTSNNSTRTFNTTSSAVAAATWVTLRIEINAAGTSADFLINGVVVHTTTTNIPTGAGRETGFGFFILKSAGTTTRTMDSDYLLCQANF